MTLTREQIEEMKLHWKEAQYSFAPSIVALCDLALVGLAVQPRPTHRHIKTGNLYSMIGSGAIQSERPLTDMQAVVIYRSDKDGTLWAREFHEFHDSNRFEALPTPERK